MNGITTFRGRNKPSPEVSFLQHVLTLGHYMCPIESPFYHRYLHFQIVCSCIATLKVPEIAFRPLTEILIGHNLVLRTTLKDGSCRKSLVTPPPPHPIEIIAWAFNM
jgi:hypothetical protein